MLNPLKVPIIESLKVMSLLSTRTFWRIICSGLAASLILCLSGCGNDHSTPKATKHQANLALTLSDAPASLPDADHHLPSVLLNKKATSFPAWGNTLNIRIDTQQVEQIAPQVLQFTSGGQTYSCNAASQTIPANSIPPHTSHMLTIDYHCNSTAASGMLVPCSKQEAQILNTSYHAPLTNLQLQAGAQPAYMQGGLLEHIIDTNDTEVIGGKKTGIDLQFDTYGKACQ